MSEDEKEKKEHVVLASGKIMTKKTWIMSGLRRMSYRWPPLNAAEKAARKERGKYQCAICGELFKAGEYAKDHINPIVPVTGFPIHPITGGPDWTIIIERLFCDEEEIQIICSADHDTKSAIEDSMRASYSKKNKEEAKQLKKEQKKK